MIAINKIHVEQPKASAKRHIRVTGGAAGYTVFEVVDTIKRVSGVDFDVLLGQRGANDPATLVASNRRARKKTGRMPRFNTFEPIVNQALDWERKLQTAQLQAREIPLAPPLPSSADLVDRRVTTGIQKAQ